MSDQVIRDSRGRMLYRTMHHMGKTRVYDSHGKLLGWCEHGQTRDAKGTLIAQSETPGLLYKEKG